MSAVLSCSTKGQTTSSPIWETEVNYQHREGKLEQVAFTEAKVARKVYYSEVELKTKVFWIQKDKLGVYAYENPKVAYLEEGGEEFFEVKDWAFKIPVSLVNWSRLPDQLARHFFEYFSRARETELSEDEQLRFAKICCQIDYPRFSRGFDPTIYMECTLVRKGENPHIRSSSGTMYKLNSSLVGRLHILNEGDYFGAEFTFDRYDNIIEINKPCLLTRASDEEIDRLLPRWEIDKVV